MFTCYILHRRVYSENDPMWLCKFYHNKLYVSCIPYNYVINNMIQKPWLTHKMWISCWVKLSRCTPITHDVTWYLIILQNLLLISINSKRRPLIVITIFFHTFCSSNKKIVPYSLRVPLKSFMYNGTWGVWTPSWWTPRPQRILIRIIKDGRSCRL